MATLKSIKNKYLTASDGTVLGVTTNTENVAALSFKLATADSLTKFNMVDGFTDDYNDATGVDAVLLLMRLEMPLEIIIGALQDLLPLWHQVEQ